MHAPPEVPPAAWIDDMRTPPLEEVLSQFRAQKGGPPAMADAADAAAPPELAAASDTAAEEPAETPRSSMPQLPGLATCYMSCMQCANFSSSIATSSS